MGTCLQSVGHSMPCDSNGVPVMGVAAIVEASREHLAVRGTHNYALHAPRATPSAGVVTCTYHHRLRPFSRHKRYCQLPVSRIQDVCNAFTLQAWFSYLPIVAGRASSIQHVARADRRCTHYGGIAVANELLKIHECFFSHSGNNTLLCLPQTLTL